MIIIGNNPIILPDHSGQALDCTVHATACAIMGGLTLFNLIGAVILLGWLFYDMIWG